MAKKKVVRKTEVNSPQSRWAEEKIRESEKVYDSIKSHDEFTRKLTFWSSLIVIVFSNFLIAIVLIPFLAVLNKWFLDLVIVVIGLMMGFIFDFLLRSIDNLERKHHLIAIIFVPLVGIFNVVISVILANQLIEQIQLNNVRESPWLIAVIYGVAFVLPYLYGLVRKKR
ncbi:hypothetical protein ACFLZB_01485 [Nanoarchaeota archaeon]